MPIRTLKAESLPSSAGSKGYEDWMHFDWENQDWRQFDWGRLAAQETSLCSVVDAEADELALRLAAALIQD